MGLAKTDKGTDNGASARLAAASAPVGSVWASQARAAARDRLLAAGLPGRRDEYWKYTNPADFNASEPQTSSVFNPDDTVPFHAVDRLKIVFVDGVYDAGQSDDLTMAGIEIETLNDATAVDIHWAKDVFGVLENTGQDPVSRSHAALNTATASQGIVIRATAKASRPISFNYRQTSDTSEAVIHHVIRVESGAELTVLENGPAAARFSCVTEVDVADGGAFHHVRTQGRAHDRRSLTHIFARIGKESLFKSFSLTANGAMTRNEFVLDVVGDDAMVHVAGAAIGDGDFHHDDTVFITHDALNCESRQVFKNVLRNGATGVFQGKILVKAGAQKTDGYQISQALLLDDDAQFLAKPELEIYADDVICSHGSTTGAIDDEAMFYLRSRGVPAVDAQDLLVLAFLAEALEEIDSEEISDDLNARLQDWLRRRRD